MKDRIITTDTMVHGPLLSNLVRFAIPVMLTCLLQVLFSAADTIVVGKFAGEEALAAVGATGSIIALLVSLFSGLGSGANVVIGQFCGSGDTGRISKAVHTSYGIAVAGGALLTVIGLALTVPMLSLMGTPESILSGSAVYMRVYFIGSIPDLVYNLGAAILRAKGDSRRPLYFLAAGGTLNVVLNLLFVIVFRMSVLGVALATVISQTFSAALVTAVLMREKDACRLQLTKIRIEPDVAAQVLRIGVPAGVQGMMYSISNVFIQAAINSFDSALIVAGNSAAANLETFIYIGMAGFSQAAITFTAQNYGARNYPRIKTIMWYTLLLDVGSSIVCSAVFVGFGAPLLSLYTNEAEVIAYGMVRMKWVALFLCLNGLLDILVCSMRGMNVSVMPTVTMMIAICGVRLAWILLVFPHFRDLGVIFMCYPISWAATSVLLGVLWRHFYRRMCRMSGTETV